MLDLDGVDEELYDFLDHIEVVTKKEDQIKEYKAFDELRLKQDSDDEDPDEISPDDVDQEMDEEEIQSEADDTDF